MLFAFLQLRLFIQLGMLKLELVELIITAAYAVLRLLGIL